MTEFEKMHERIDSLEREILSLRAQNEALKKQCDFISGNRRIAKDDRSKKDAENIAAIVKLVCYHLDIQERKFWENVNRRFRGYVIARQIVSVIAHNVFEMPKKTIGRHLGGADHSTIIYAINEGERLIASDREYSFIYNFIRNSVIYGDPNQ